jgi:hypothetical protein
MELRPELQPECMHTSCAGRSRGWCCRVLSQLAVIYCVCAVGGVFLRFSLLIHSVNASSHPRTLPPKHAFGYRDKATQHE